MNQSNDLREKLENNPNYCNSRRTRIICANAGSSIKSSLRAFIAQVEDLSTTKTTRRRVIPAVISEASASVLMNIAQRTINDEAVIKLVEDIFSGPDGADLFYLTVFNNELYFAADDGNTGRELWKYDGTNPPSLVADINSGPSGSFPNDLAVFNNELYFSAKDGTNGFELWKYDGTNPPSLVADIFSGGNSAPEYLTVFNNELYFQANDGNTGRELWKYDGTNAPSLVADIFSGPRGSFSNQLIVFNNELYFEANDGITGDELWVLIP